MNENKENLSSEEKQIVARINTAIQNIESIAMRHNSDVRTLFNRFGGSSIDGKKDINNECGYPEFITAKQYKEVFDREPVAARSVSILPEESWSNDPVIYETEDDGQETEFESGIKKLINEYQLFDRLLGADILSKIGHYGIILFGLTDENSRDFQLPFAGYDESSRKWSENSRSELLYMRAFPENNVTIDQFDNDPTSPRYGKPVIYSIQYEDPVNDSTTRQSPEQLKSLKVHWTRCLHIADGLLESEVFGTPELKACFNNILNLRKIYGASGEGYWKNAFPSMIFEMEPEAAGKILANEDLHGKVKNSFEQLSVSLQKYFIAAGGTVKTVAGTIEDPTPHIIAQIKAICIALEVPWRVFLGSEAEKNAGDQDKKAWNKRLMRRQEKYISPKILRPLIDRFMDYGILARVDEYFIDWPDLNEPTAEELSESAETKAKALGMYDQYNIESIMTREDFLIQLFGYSAEEAEQLVKNADAIAVDVNGTEEDEVIDEEDDSI